MPHVRDDARRQVLSPVALSPDLAALACGEIRDLGW